VADPATGQRARHLFAAARFSEAVPVGLQAATEAEDRQGFPEAAELLLRALPYVDGDVERARLLVRVGGVSGVPAIRPAPNAMSRRRPAGRESPGHGHGRSGPSPPGRVNWEQSRQDVARVEYERAREVLDPLGPKPLPGRGLCPSRQHARPTSSTSRRSSSWAGPRTSPKPRARTAPPLGAWVPGLCHTAIGELELGYEEFRRVRRGLGPGQCTSPSTRSTTRWRSARSRSTLERRSVSPIVSTVTPPVPGRPPVEPRSGRSRTFALGAERESRQRRAVIEMGRESGVTTYGFWSLMLWRAWSSSAGSTRRAR
jgi:hypothetical protein